MQEPPEAEGHAPQEHAPLPKGEPLLPAPWLAARASPGPVLWGWSARSLYGILKDRRLCTVSSTEEKPTAAFLDTAVAGGEDTAPPLGCTWAGAWAGRNGVDIGSPVTEGRRYRRSSRDDSTTETEEAAMASPAN